MQAITILYRLAVGKGQSYALTPTCILPRTYLTTGYNIVPSGTHFYPLFMLCLCDIVKMKTFAFF